MTRTKKNVPRPGSDPKVPPPQKITIKRPTSSDPSPQTSIKKQKSEDNESFSSSDSESMVSDATLTAQISSVFQTSPRSSSTTMHISTPEKSNSSLSSPIPSKDHPSVEPKFKPPPPLITTTSAWKNVATKLMTAVPIESITVKSFRNDSVKIQCTDTDMFRIVQKYFNNTQTEFFTFPSPDEKILKVVIRGLPTVISDTELAEELVSKDYEVITVRQFVKAGVKLPLYMVSLSNNPASKSIFNEPSLFYIAVKVEAYKATNPAQCFKCQRFCHSSIYCGFTPRCV